jgi:hypothetical protein
VKDECSTVASTTKVRLGYSEIYLFRVGDVCNSVLYFCLVWLVNQPSKITKLDGETAK